MEAKLKIECFCVLQAVIIEQFGCILWHHRWSRVASEHALHHFVRRQTLLVMGPLMEVVRVVAAREESVGNRRKVLQPRRHEFDFLDFGFLDFDDGFGFVGGGRWAVRPRTRHLAASIGFLAHLGRQVVARLEVFDFSDRSELVRLVVMLWLMRIVVRLVRMRFVVVRPMAKFSVWFQLEKRRAVTNFCVDLGDRLLVDGNVLKSESLVENAIKAGKTYLNSGWSCLGSCCSDWSSIATLCRRICGGRGRRWSDASWDHAERQIDQHFTSKLSPREFLRCLPFLRLH